MAKKFTASSQQLKPDPKYHSKLVSKFINCLMWDGKKSVAQQVFYDAMDIIRSRYNTPPGITELARMVGLNTTNLKSGFKAEFGDTIFQCVHRFRMEHAAALLLETDINVSETAWRVGYNSVSAFSAAFKQEMGVSPSRLKQDLQ